MMTNGEPCPPVSQTVTPATAMLTNRTARSRGRRAGRYTSLRSATGVLAAVVFVASCTFAPRASPPSPTDSPSPGPTDAPATEVATPLTTPQSTALLELGSAAWFQWLPSEVDDMWSLTVGRLDGRTFTAIEAGNPIFARGAMGGPARGLVLASYVDPSEQTVIELIDTADGRRTLIAGPRDGSVNLGALDPSGSYVLWTTADREQITGLWRRQVSGGPAEKLLDGPEVPGPYIHFSVDGELISLSGWSKDTGWTYGVFDTELQLVGEVRSAAFGEVVGFLGDRLVVYQALDPDDILRFPLYAVDIRDGSGQEIVSGEGSRAAIVATEAGEAKLLFEGRDDRDHYVLNALGTDGSTRRLFVGEGPWDDPPISFVTPTTLRGVDAAGWVAIFPGGRALGSRNPDDDPGTRTMIRVSDGQSLSVPFVRPEP